MNNGVSIFLFVLLPFFVSYPVSVLGQGNATPLKDPALVRTIAEQFSGALENQTDVLSRYLAEKFSFCIKDRQSDWNGAFNFTSNLTFLAACALKTNDLPRRLCTAAEIKFYFTNFIQSKGKVPFLKPNINCNTSNWVPGCEPGWASSVDVTQGVDPRESTEIPSRTRDSQPCCEGFFCPRGLTCMIPCPLGAYCPLAKFNDTTGLCDPYLYQLPPGKNHSCGAADKWADVGTSSEVFCSAGSYCPTTTEEITCDTGSYCRMGSTSESRCFKLASCNPNTANQSIKAYGVMLFVALSTLLLIIYNCSDQVLTIRERRAAKSREAAASSAREASQAVQRWKAAKKHAIELHKQLSHSFSRKRVVKGEELRALNQSRMKSDDSLMPDGPTESSSSVPSEVSTSRKEEIHGLEKGSDSAEGFHLETNNKHDKKMPKQKHIHTRSQIFKYAYGQLEKEKVMQQQDNGLTFSGVVSLATNNKMRVRPPIEVAFKDLTLTLKAKKRHLLRCVTGKLVPGRVSAVMGPSGAGKTTFLNALAGKATGCTKSGVILINGKMEPIHSYKKITGFVPQDDIVHGNLTVEENLWFSANCRLPSNLTKADRVLVVERVIESLGLQPVRASLVGTVEKRGISGGQRKRVNVGLEMVMEPSLLILDEPTSGLDSASSQLLLKALRREALEGVNVCLVVHQPSYTLFRMFDDLVLLAKGGLIVYHGPVKQVEEYFSGLGITVPDHVNPPDHFIDILEGIVKPYPNSTLNYKQLPVTWMLHNGYEVPPDMQASIPGVNASSSHGTASSSEPHAHVAETEAQTFAGELWQDVQSTMEIKRDKIHHNFLIKKDLSNRRIPGIFRQYRYFLGRVGKQRLREARTQAVDLLILLLAGACLGVLAKVNDETMGAAGYTYTVIAISLLCKIAALRSFSLDKLQYWRESSSGISSLAYFLSKDTIDHFNTIVKPVAYLSMFYFFNNPRSTFLDNYIVLVALIYCVTGIAYIFAILLEPGPAQLWSVLLPVVSTLIATQGTKSALVNILAKASYSKWAMEAFIISNAQRYSGVWLITRCGALMKSGYSISSWPLCITILFLYGFVTRVIAYVCMITFQKK